MGANPGQKTVKRWQFQYTDDWSDQDNYPRLYVTYDKAFAAAQAENIQGHQYCYIRGVKVPRDMGFFVDERDIEDWVNRIRKGIEERAFGDFGFRTPEGVFFKEERDHNAPTPASCNELEKCLKGWARKHLSLVMFAESWKKVRIK